MKKALLTLLFAAAMLPAVAQNTTLSMPMEPPANYYRKCAEWLLDTPSHTHIRIIKYATSARIITIYGQPLEDTLRVVGLAGIFDTLLYPNIDLSHYIDLDMQNRLPEYMFLYQPRPDTLELLKQVQWNNTEPKCKILLRATRPVNPPNTVWETPSLYEVYFDDTVTVQDSFYVGCSLFNYEHLDFGLRVPTAVYTVGADKPGCHLYPATSRYRWTPPDRDTNWHSVGEGIGLFSVFPIIDTTGMFADTTQDGDTTSVDTTIVDTTIVDTTFISQVVDQFTYLMPNPASGQAVLYSSFPIRQVTVYDPAGRCVLHRRVDDRTLRLDLSGYAKGTYLVVVRTPAGRTVKRLVVQ